MPIYVKPERNKDAFNCSRCHAYAKQDWSPTVAFGSAYLGGEYNNSLNLLTRGVVNDLAVSVCSHCGEPVIWYKEKILFPRSQSVPISSEELPKGILDVYNEADEVYGISPRASGALIRLALEELLKQVNKNDKKLNDNINELIKKGIAEEIVDAMSVLRVGGNEILHAGEISILDSSEGVFDMFQLFNMIVEDLINRPKKLKESYNRISESKRAEIEKMKGK